MDKEKEEKDLASEVINMEDENEVVADDEDTKENEPDAEVTVEGIRNKTSRKRFKSVKLILSFSSKNENYVHAAGKKAEWVSAGEDHDADYGGGEGDCAYWVHE